MKTLNELSRRADALAPPPAAGKDVPEMYIAPDNLPIIARILEEQKVDAEKLRDWQKNTGRQAHEYISPASFREIGDLLAKQKRV